MPKIPHGSEGMINSIYRVLDFNVGNTGLIFGELFTIFGNGIFNIDIERPIFAYKFFKIDVKSTKIVSKMKIMDRITKKS